MLKRGKRQQDARPDASETVAHQLLRGGGLIALREHNKAAALRLLLDHGPLSRTDLAGLLELSQPAISYITAELLASGIVVERPAERPAIANGPGRHAVPLDLVPPARWTLGVHVGATGLEISLIDLRARVADKRGHRIDHASWGLDPDGLVRAVAASVRDLLLEHGIDKEDVLGVGLGVAGWVDGDHGLVRQHAQLGWRDVPIAAAIAGALELPVALDEHVRSLALAEAWFGAARKAQSFALFYAGAVVGCSIVFERRVHRGRQAAAGVIGSLPAGTAGPILEAPTPDGWGGTERDTLETAVSEPALARQAKVLAQRYPDSTIARWLQQEPAGTVPRSDRLAQIVSDAANLERAHPGSEDDPGLALLRARAEALAPYVAHVIATYDPDLFVITGPMAWDASQLQLRLLREAISVHAPALAERLPEISPSAFGPAGALIGAGALVLRDLYSPPLAGNSDGPAATSAEIRRRAWMRRHK
jgi:predicted NBD/HSP70 family sugar kinase